MFDTDLMIIAIPIFLGLLWIAVRVAGNAWFAAKRAHTEVLLNNMQEGKKHDEQTTV